MGNCDFEGDDFGDDEESDLEDDDEAGSEGDDLERFEAERARRESEASPEAVAARKAFGVLARQMRDLLAVNGLPHSWEDAKAWIRALDRVNPEENSDHVLDGAAEWIDAGFTIPDPGLFRFIEPGSAFHCLQSIRMTPAQFQTEWGACWFSDHHDFILELEKRLSAGAPVEHYSDELHEELELRSQERHRASEEERRRSEEAQRARRAELERWIAAHGDRTVAELRDGLTDWLKRRGASIDAAGLEDVFDSCGGGGNEVTRRCKDAGICGPALRVPLMVLAAMRDVRESKDGCQGRAARALQEMCRNDNWPPRRAEVPLLATGGSR